MTRLDIQISVEEGDWPSEDTLQAMAERVLGEAADFLVTELSQPFPAMQPELSLVFTDDASIREINAEWRQQDKPTNVLSFPAGKHDDQVDATSGAFGELVMRPGEGGFVSPIVITAARSYLGDHPGAGPTASGTCARCP